MKWKNIKIEKPVAYKTGHWDGKKSDPFLAMDKNGNYHIGTMYEGHFAGENFCDFVNDDEVESEIVNITHWIEIPSID